MRTSAITVAAATILGLALSACGGSSSKTSTTSTTVAVQVTAASLSIYATQTDVITPTVTGSTNTAVTWSIQEAAGGTISASGLYTAPATAGTYHVIATSQADTTKSATVAVAVTIPNPTFTQPPSVTLASVGATYTYTFAATDPAGTAITYSLTTAVAGASISGSKLTWTPTSTEMAAPTSFTAKATTALGGSATTQPWTVTPLRTVTITAVDNFWSATGVGTAPIPAIPAPVDVIVPGSATHLTSSPNSDFSTYTINNVPVGYYWLEIGPGEKYYTNTSTFDVGTDYVGQQLTGSLSQMTFTVGDSTALPPTGLTIPSWGSGNVLWVGSANGNSWFAPATQPTGSGVYTDTELVPFAATDIGLPALDSTDDSYILEYVPNTPGGSGTYYGTYISAYQSLGSIASTATAYTPTIGGSLTSVSNTTLELTTSGWDTLATQDCAGLSSLCGPTFFGTYLSVQPYTTTPSLAAIGGGMPSCEMGSPYVGCGKVGSDYQSINGWPSGTGPEPATVTNAPHNDRQNGSPGPLYVAWAERCNGVTNVIGTADGCAGPPTGDTIDLSFNAPFTTAPPYVLWSQQETSVGITGYTTYFVTYSNSAVEYANASLPASATVQPTVMPVGSPSVNGSWTSPATHSAPIVVSWTAPSTTGGAKLAGYDVVVYAVPSTSGGTWGSSLAKFYTANTSITLPTGVLAAGTYVFVIEAVADGTATPTTQPFRSAYPKGTAQIVSQPMTLSTGS